MTRFLLSVHGMSGEDREPMTPEAMEASWARIQALEVELHSAGAWVFSGRLDEPAAASVMRPASGKVSRTDGPYAESKEQIGGFYIIEAPDLDAALQWGSRTALAVGRPIEVRPFVASEA